MASGQRAAATGTEDGDAAEAAQARAARLAAKERLARGGVLTGALTAVTALMTLDVWVLGRVRTGPFFVLLERTATPAASARRAS